MASVTSTAHGPGALVECQSGGSVKPDGGGRVRGPLRSAWEPTGHRSDRPLGAHIPSCARQRATRLYALPCPRRLAFRPDASPAYSAQAHTTMESALGV